MSKRLWIWFTLLILIVALLACQGKDAAAQDDFEFYRLINGMVFELRVSHLFVVPPTLTEYLESADTCAGSAGLDVRLVGGQVVVTTVAPGYPAEAAGLRPGDVILTVEGLPAERADELMLFHLPVASEEERLAGALATVRGFFYGEPGTSVSITHLDAQEQMHEVQLLRQQRTKRLAESSEGRPPFYVEVQTRQPEGGMGHIRFSAFHTGVFQEVLDAIDAMQGTPGLILDRRGNPGGFYPVRKGTAEKFFQERTLSWQYETRPGLELPGFEHEGYLEPAEPVYTGSVVILTDGLSGLVQRGIRRGHAGDRACHDRRTAHRRQGPGRRHRPGSSHRAVL
jgi:C-terminal processing protease CtpA/Prc